MNVKIKKMKEKIMDAVVANWMTTLAGLVAAFSTFVMMNSVDFPDWTLHVAQCALVGGLVCLGIAGKDFTRPQGKKLKRK